MDRSRFRAPRRLAFALLIVMAGYMSLAQPGLCSCWLIAEVKDIHPHPDGQPDRPHDHRYLFEIFQAQNIAIANIYVVAVAVLIASLAGASLWHQMLDQAPGGNGWSSPPDIPPPRLAFSS